MPWNTEILTMLRHMIDDLDIPYTYTDDRLQELILITGQQIQQEISFNTVYIISLDNMTIIPDPTGPSNRDEGFLWLDALKSACTIARSELKKISNSAIYVKDGERTVDMKGALQGKKEAADQFCKDYTDARFRFLSNNTTGLGIFGAVGWITPSLYGGSSFSSYSAPRDRPIFT